MQKDILFPRGVFGYVQNMTSLGLLVRPFSLLLLLLDLCFSLQNKEKWYKKGSHLSMLGPGVDI